MRLMIETTAPLSETDYKILSLLLERHQSVAPEAANLAKKATETPKADPKKAEPTKKAEPEPEPEETPAEPVGDAKDQPVTEATMEAAVSKAKALMQDGKKATVREALETAGVARVGEIGTEGQALAFLQALDA